ncbi:MAG: energy transducer TonB [Chthoniobacter sp.]|nr:energy transducer TonB [Chthoniobacter sp.]
MFARIPDLSEIPTGRLIGIGIAISLLLHLLAFLMIPLIALFFKDHDVDFAKTVKPREIELQVVPPEEEEQRPPPFTITPPYRPFLDSRGLDIAKDPAQDPLFESDENMKAASEQPATGDSMLPGQVGKQLPFNAFQNTRSLLGPAPEPFSPTQPAVQPLPTPPPPTVQVAQVPDPTPPADAPQDPTPPPPDAEKVEEKTPTPEKEKTKPTAFKAVEKLLDEDIAITKRELKPKAVTQIERPANTPNPVAHAAMLRPLDDQMVKLTTPVPQPQPQPQPRHESGYQPEQERNHIESSISNRGKSAVDAVATPMGKYRKQVSDAIGSRWHYYVNDKMSLFAIGSVRISFSVDAQGHVSRVKVESNSSNQSLEDVSIQAIRDAELAPPPPNPALPPGEDPFEWTINFTYYHIQ